MKNMKAGVEEATAVLAAAVAAKQAHQRAQSAERAKLSATGWRRALLRYADHGPEVVTALRERMRAQPHLHAEASAYLHGVARLIADSAWWSPGAAAVPIIGNADKTAAQAEVMATPGANLFTLLTAAVDDAEKLNPAAFGHEDDLAKHERARREVAERAEQTLAALLAMPPVLMEGLASTRGVLIHPRGNLASRLLDDAVAHSGQQAVAAAR